MPVRSNPYLPTSSDVYSSRGLGSQLPGPNNSGPIIATQLGQLAGDALGALTYNPNNDPRATNAMLDRIKARDLNSAEAGRVYVGANAGNKDISLSDLATGFIQHGGSVKGAGDVDLLAHMLRDDPNMDIGTTLDRGAVLRGEAPGSTYSAGTYAARTKPTNVVGKDGKVTLSTAQDAIGQTPVLTDSEVKGSILSKLASDSVHPLSRAEMLAAGGAEPKQVTPFTIRKPDGSTAVVTGADAMGDGNALVSPTGSMSDLGLTNTVKSGVQNSDLALKNFKDLVGLTRSIAAKDPTLFGATGEVRRLTQEASQQVKNIGSMFGSKSGDIDGVYKDAVSLIQKQGITIPGFGTYDPNLPQIKKLSVLLAYSGASALAGQENRSVSDADIKRFSDTLGDPTKLFSSQQEYLAGLDLADQLADMKQARNAEVVKPPKSAPAVSSETITPPAVASEPQEGQTATNKVTGEKLTYRNGQWVK